MGYYPTRETLQRAFIDWIAFRARSIPQRPREVLLSAEVVAKAAHYPTIGQLRDVLVSGQDARPWLSRKLTKHRSDPRADLLFNDWQISHFHLGRLFVSPMQVRGSPHLLFAYLSADLAVFLDVMPHSQWACQELLRILSRTRSDILERFRMRGVLPGKEVYTDEQMMLLRSSGVNAPIVIDGNLYIAPGLGISGSGHATRHVMFAMQFQRVVHATRDAITKNNLPSDWAAFFARQIGVPVRLGVAMQDNGTLQIVDKARGVSLYTTRAVE